MIAREKYDLILTDCNLINVFTDEIYLADVAICGEKIVGVGSYKSFDAKRKIDCKGKYVCPGFIDAHVHIESTMLTPPELCKIMLKCGTTTLIADPHEVVNVSGKSAIDWLLGISNDIPLDIYYMLPSSVPCSVYETNGSEFTADDMKSYIDNKRVMGLGEVMCYPDVIRGDKVIYEKISLCNEKTIDGHAPGVVGRDLDKYVMAGVENDHECTTFDEMKEKLRAGLRIYIREGSGAKNLNEIVAKMLRDDLPTDRFCFCTDDRHVDDMLKDGHIDNAVRKAISLGMKPITAIKMATLQAAESYKIKNLGAVAAGYKADLLILDDLETIKISDVIKSGVMFDDIEFPHYDVKLTPKEMLNSVHFGTITPETIKYARNVDCEDDVIEVIPTQILTKHVKTKLDGDKYFKPNSEISKAVVVERHRNTGNVAVCPIKGFNIHGGAVAASVGHDSHNIIAVGDNDNDIILAINQLKTLQGGYVVTEGGKVSATLPLPICGLMSELDYLKVNEQLLKVNVAAMKIGIPENLDVFHTLSFLSLPVIPELRLTDKGIFDVNRFCLIEKNNT